MSDDKGGVAIEVEDVGPVEVFGYTMEQPGLHLLEGDHGKGKTTVLKTVEIASGVPVKEKPTKRRGTKKGKATVGGKRVSITSKTNTSGDLGWEGLGDLDITAIHYPNLQGARKRDAKRILALLRVAEVGADLERFSEVDGIDELDLTNCPNGDLVEMTGYIKREFEKKAREVANRAAEKKTEKDAAASLIQGVDLETPVNMDELVAAQTAAVQVKTELANRAAEQLTAAADAKKSQEWIEQREKEQPPALHSVEQIDGQIAESKQSIESLQEELQLLQTRISDAQTDLAGLQELRQSTVEDETALNHHKAVIEAFEQLDTVTAEQASEAAADVEAAAEAIKSANNREQAQRSQEAAQQAEIDERKLNAQVDQLRRSAADTVAQLSKAVESIPGCPIKAELDDDGAAVLKVAADGVEFDEKSDGERWKLVVPICFKPDRIIVIPQAAFGELNEDTVDFLNQSAIDNESFILTAKVAADGSPLTGRAWGEAAG